MTRRELIEYYRKFDEDELFYRDYYQADGNDEAIHEILERLKKNMEHRLDVWIPELDMHGDKFLAELLIAPENGNLSVRKHTRYNPLFVHSHSFFELIYVLTGFCMNTIEERPIRMEKGDLCIIAPGMQHSLGIFDDDSIALNILVRKTTFRETFFDVFQKDAELTDFFYRNYYSEKQERFICFHTAGNQELETLLDILFTESIQQKEYAPRVMENLLRAIFCVMLRMTPEKIFVRKMSEGQQNREQILRYIQTHYTDITFDGLVRHFHLSESSLRRFFRQNVGRSFVEFVREIRLQKACMLLQNTKMQVGDVAAQVGYESEEYFYRLFKNQYGITPLEYRKQNGG